MKKLFSAPRLLALVAITALAALALATAGGVAAHPGKGKGHAKAHAKAKAKAHAKACAKTLKVGYVVHGTLVSYTADVEGTPANEAVVVIEVTRANRHARHAGVEVGAQITLTAALDEDAFNVIVEGFVAPDAPGAGDLVHVIGKVAVTKKKCAPDGTSTEDRYLEANVRKVIISDRDAEVEL